MGLAITSLSLEPPGRTSDESIRSRSRQRDTMELALQAAEQRLSAANSKWSCLPPSPPPSSSLSRRALPCACREEACEAFQPRACAFHMSRGFFYSTCAFRVASWNIGAFTRCSFPSSLPPSLLSADRRRLGQGRVHGNRCSVCAAGDVDGQGLCGALLEARPSDVSKLCFAGCREYLPPLVSLPPSLPPFLSPFLSSSPSSPPLCCQEINRMHAPAK